MGGANNAGKTFPDVGIQMTDSPGEDKTSARER
jgi:hypothetical protein